MNKNNPEVIELRGRIEDSFGRKIKTPKDFECLSELIWERIHITISPTTLKRLWSYISGGDKTRLSTLNILASFVGFKDWEEYQQFLTINNKGVTEKITRDFLSARQLDLGEIIEIGWQPNNYLRLENLGNSKFRVIHTTSHDIKMGGIYCCDVFIENEILYLQYLKANRIKHVVVIAANTSGITSLKRHVRVR